MLSLPVSVALCSLNDNKDRFNLCYADNCAQFPRCYDATLCLSFQVDHTSVLQFIEKRFNVTCPNISPWRRAVAGDLTAAFDFTSAPDYTWPDLPDTSSYVAAANQQCADLPSPPIPTTQSMPYQEAGTKVAR